MIFMRRTCFITISCAVNTNECDAGDVQHVLVCCIRLLPQPNDSIFKR